MEGKKVVRKILKSKQNIIEIEAQLISLTRIHMTVHFPCLVQELL